MKSFPINLLALYCHQALKGVRKMKSTEEVIEILREFKRTAGEKYGIEQLALFDSTVGEGNRRRTVILMCA